MLLLITRYLKTKMKLRGNLAGTGGKRDTDELTLDFFLLILRILRQFHTMAPSKY